MPKTVAPKDTNPNENSATILNDVRSALLNVNEDFSEVIEKFKSIKDVLDDMLQKELGYNENLRQIQLQQAMLALIGSDDLQGVYSLDDVTKKILERQEKLTKLRALVALLTGQGGQPYQQVFLNKQINVLIKQNILARSIMHELLKGTMINGRTKDIDANKLIQVSNAIAVHLKGLQELNRNFRNANRIDPNPNRPKLS